MGYIGQKQQELATLQQQRSQLVQQTRAALRTTPGKENALITSDAEYLQRDEGILAQIHAAQHVLDRCQYYGQYVDVDAVFARSPSSVSEAFDRMMHHAHTATDLRLMRAVAEAYPSHPLAGLRGVLADQTAAVDQGFLERYKEEAQERARQAYFHPVGRLSLAPTGVIIGLQLCARMADAGQHPMSLALTLIAFAPFFVMQMADRRMTTRYGEEHWQEYTGKILATEYEKDQPAIRQALQEMQGMYGAPAKQEGRALR